MNATNEHLQEEILATLARPTAPWFPELTSLLVSSGWEVLSNESGISSATYSTAGVMRCDPSVKGKLLSVDMPVPSESHPSLEFIADDLRTHFKPKEFRFFDIYEVAENGTNQTLRTAFEWIATLPSLYGSVVQPVKSIHILESTVEGYDISFSDPSIAFSIFVSVPNENSSYASLRMAEAIIHESMHLQLSLLETQLPLAISQAAKYFSPWKKGQRSASGVLHALYVFTVIDAWLRQLPASVNTYSVIRRREIARQVAEIVPICFAELTKGGEELRKYLLSQH